MDQPRRSTRRARLCAARPGPLAAQLAIYLGWCVAGCSALRWWDRVRAPSFLMVLVRSALYVRFGGLPMMARAVLRIGCRRVIAIIAARR